MDEQEMENEFLKRLQIKINIYYQKFVEALWQLNCLLTFFDK